MSVSFLPPLELQQSLREVSAYLFSSFSQGTPLYEIM